MAMFAIGQSAASKAKQMWHHGVQIVGILL